MQQTRATLAIGIGLATTGCALFPGLVKPADAPVVDAHHQIAVGNVPHGLAAAGGYVYNSNTGAGSISVIDTATDAVVKTIELPAGGKPGYAKAFHDGRHVMVADQGNKLIMVLDPAAGHAAVQTFPVGEGIDKIALSRDDRTALVSLTGESKLARFTFDADLSRPPARVDHAVGTVAGEGNKHRALSFDGSWAVAPNSGENNVSLIDIGTGTSRTVSDGNSPGPVCICPKSGGGTVAAVGYGASNLVALYDVAGGSPKLVSGIGLAPTDMLSHDGLKRLFVSMAGSNEVAAIDYDGGAVLGRLPVGKRPVHIYLAPETGTLENEIWVGNDDGASVTVIDASTLRVRAHVRTGNGHHKMAFSGNKAYVSNLKDSTVSVIDRTRLP